MKKLISVIVIVIVNVNMLSAQVLPHAEGQRARYSVQIDIKKAYVSGIMAMLFEDGILKASVVNEFGVSALDFQYNPAKDKVKIISTMKKLDHWYIRKVLKNDLRQLLHNVEAGQLQYRDEKYNITYTLSNVDVDVDEK